MNEQGNTPRGAQKQPGSAQSRQPQPGREEKRGKVFKEEFKRHGHWRKRGHDYRASSIYHITINKVRACEDFSVLTCEELSVEGVKTTKKDLGFIILQAMRIMEERAPEIKIYQYCIMPDHIHLLLHVKARLPKPLGIYIGGLKAGVANEWRRQKGRKDIDVFEDGFNDRIIFPTRDLDTVFKYIRQNPYRLLVRREHPEFFTKRRNVDFAGSKVQIYGNAFLMRNPFCYSLIIHRSDTESDYERKLEECRYYAANGGVIVSAFISQKEKAIRAAVEEEGGRIILIHHYPLGDREKPDRHNFELCCEGRLLLVSPLKYLEDTKRDKPTRAQCLEMNALGERFCGGKN